MKWPQAALVLVALGTMLGLLGLQSWLGGRQRARQQAAFEVWQEQARSGPGQPIPPPLRGQPFPVLPWFPLLFPALLFPLWLATVEQQRQQRRRHEEEEDQTPYAEEDLMQDWEFKIIRSPRGLFDQPGFLDSVLQEEAQGGWRLVEKFDGTRVRLKRLTPEQPPASDLPAAYDPYRTNVEPRVAFYVPWWIFCALWLVQVPCFVLLQLSDPISAWAFCSLLAGAGLGAVVLAGLALRQTARNKRSAHVN